MSQEDLGLCAGDGGEGQQAEGEGEGEGGEGGGSTGHDGSLRGVSCRSGAPEDFYSGGEKKGGAMEP